MSPSDAFGGAELLDTLRAHGFAHDLGPERRSLSDEAMDVEVLEALGTIDAEIACGSR